MTIKKQVQTPLYYFSRMDKEDKLNKFADATHIDPVLMEEARKAFKNRQHERNVVFIALAVTSWEWYGMNDNGDSFYEENISNIVENIDTLPVAFKTFEGKPLNRYHQQKGENSGIGKIHYAYYNQDQHRVELVCEAFWDKAPAECIKIKRGVPLKVSMSCATPFDYCPVCGNAAATLDDHCDHIKYELMSIIDGVPVEMINRPTYSELSLVVIPGDQNCNVMYSLK